MAVCSVLGARVAWHCELDPAASRVLARRWPDVPNLGDITAVDWSTVETVDVLTGGFPCQDVSHAGRRAGLGPGTRTGLWSAMADAIDQLRPPLVIAENVRGLLSARADSDVEPCPWCVGDDEGEPALRALGAVLADLADLGYDAVWHGLRAADVGAPHGRFRVFIAAWPAPDTVGVGRNRGTGAPGTGGGGEPPHGGHAPTDPEGVRRDEGRPEPEGIGGRLDVAVRSDADWGPYAAAVSRWERVTGRPAPAPTEPGTKGQPRLSPAFVEWMMGLSRGHVTDVPGVSRNDQLKILGNGVVPQQAAAAIPVLLAHGPQTARQ